MAWKYWMNSVSHGEFGLNATLPCLQVYRGYVDDPRNTDNAWMETVAMNFHDEEGTSVGLLDLQVSAESLDPL